LSGFDDSESRELWIPVYTGMTEKGDFQLFTISSNLIPIFFSGDRNKEREELTKGLFL